MWESVLEFIEVKTRVASCHIARYINKACTNEAVIRNGDSVTERFGSDVGVSSKLTDEWKAALNKHIASWPQGKTEDLLKTVKTLNDAGVDILVGSDRIQQFKSYPGFDEADKKNIMSEIAKELFPRFR